MKKLIVLLMIAAILIAGLNGCTGHIVSDAYVISIVMYVAIAVGITILLLDDSGEQPKDIITEEQKVHLTVIEGEPLEDREIAQTVPEGVVLKLEKIEVKEDTVKVFLRPEGTAKSTFYNWRVKLSNIPKRMKVEIIRLLPIKRMQTALRPL